jgi:hypothetical protein
MVLPRATSSVVHSKRHFPSVFPWTLKADISPGEGLETCRDLRYEQWMSGFWTVIHASGSYNTTVEDLTRSKNPQRRQAGNWFQDLLRGQNPKEMTEIKDGSAALCSVDNDSIGVLHYEFSDAPGATQNLVGSPGYSIGDQVPDGKSGWSRLTSIEFHLSVTHKLWTKKNYRIHERTFQLIGTVTNSDTRRLIVGPALP